MLGERGEEGVMAMLADGGGGGGGGHKKKKI
jgi:hypothetical protein